MIHASAELVEAMAGCVGGFSAAMSACEAYDNDDKIWGWDAHNLESGAAYDAAWGDVKERARQLVDHRRVVCAACLALMAEARGPERTAELLVYADQLDERGESVRADALRTAVLFVPGESAARRKTA